MEAKNTTTKWRYDFVPEGNGPLSGKFIVHDYNPMEPVAVCNSEDHARLIAAAPDLLKASQDLAEILRGWPMPGMKAEFDALMAAVAKATGSAS